MYFIVIGFAIVSYPKTEITFIIARLIQGLIILEWGYLLLSDICCNKLKITHFNVLVNIWWFIWIALSFYYKSDARLTAIFYWIIITLFLLFGKKYWKQDMTNSLKILSIVFSVFVYLNALLFLLYPDGLWIETNWVGSGDTKRYLFGNYNSIGIVCLCSLITQGAYTLQSQKGFVNLYCLIIVSLCNVIYAGSATSSVGLSIVALYILFRKKVKHPFTIIFIFIGLYITFIVAIIFLGHSVADYPILIEFIQNVLGKDATFTTRTQIWFNTINIILQHPLFGFGYQSTNWNAMHIGASGPHNLWLEILMYGGIISAVGFIILLIKSMHTIYHNPSDSSILVGVGLCVLLLMSLFETYSLFLIFMIIQIAYYTQYINTTAE